MHPLDEKFLESRLPQRKLEIALERLFQSEPLPPNWRKTYTDYIRTRIYPALLFLARQTNCERLQQLLAFGWADPSLCLRLLREEKIRDIQIRAILLTAGAPPRSHPYDPAALSSGSEPTDAKLNRTASKHFKPDRIQPDPAKPESPKSDDIASDGSETKALEANRLECPALPAGKQFSGPRILTLWGRRLGLEFPALRNVLSALRFQEVTEKQPPGTDGDIIFYNREQLEQLVISKTGYPAYLHMILHCLFFHIFPLPGVDLSLWNLACDTASEILAGRMFPGYFTDRQKEARTLLGVDEQFPLTSAAAIYRFLETCPEQAQKLLGRFDRDDHCRWYQETDRLSKNRTDADKKVWLCRQNMLRQWAQAAGNATGSHRAATPHFGFMPGSRQDRMEKREAGKYDFGRYLKRFSVTREEMQLDTDSFDYIPYHYGIEHYGNLPFLEPLEYTEANKVEELVIAIDTSGSCSVALVRRFLGETRKMLTEKEHFFTRMNVHIFQCDSMIQDYRLIHSKEAWNRYEETLSIFGRGGTNFTPVFDRVKKMLETGSIKKLKGLLYFSDGDGIYPREKPPYETAFIFPDLRFTELKIPDWIVKLCLKTPSAK